MMTNTPSRGGSSVSARDRTPSLNLTPLAQLLAKILKPKAGVAPLAPPLVAIEGSRITLNSRALLGLLANNPEFSSCFSPSSDTGFVRDIALPPFGTTAKVGGRLLPGTEAKTSEAFEALHEAISGELDAVLAGVDLKTFTHDTTDASLRALASSLSEAMPAPSQTAGMVPVHFSAEDRRAEDRSHDVARVLTAIETIDGGDWLEVLLGNIAQRLRRDEVDEDEVAAILHNIRNQRQQSTSQVRRFLDFLDGEALARVRLQVSLRIMSAVAQHGNKLLAEYVRRVRACYELFGGPDGEALNLDASQMWGQYGAADLAQYLRQALFYGCLPVWAEWSTQLFETRNEPSKGFATLREVSYRFRVNGVAPKSGKPAFDTRVSELQERLMKLETGDPRTPRALSQAVFLHLVLPFDSDSPETPDMAEHASRFAEQLKADPKATLTAMFESLLHRSQMMEGIAGDLIGVLQTKSKRIVAETARSVEHFTVSVHRNIINWDAVMSMSSASTDILVRPDRGPDAVAWFSHLSIADTPIVAGSIASYKVKTELRERSLTASGAALQVPMSRDLTVPSLPIRFVPIFKHQKSQRFLVDLQEPKLFDARCGIEVLYESKLLSLNRATDGEKAKSEQLRAAAATAFAIITYVTLWELIRRIRAAREGRLSATLIRLQSSGREAPDSHGSSAVYAISQALEKALSREVPVKLQGIVVGQTPLSGQAEKPVTLWQKRGAFQALLGGQPLNFKMEGSAERVALITYVTRPCDTHPNHEDADGFVFVSRTYTAVRSGEQAKLSLDGMRSRFVERRGEFSTPQLILEELARLRKEGFAHVMLLSHHFGNRHLGRGAERNSPHASLEFLDDAAKRFPEMQIYTLRRDVFPATRLHKRIGAECAFEVTQFADHQAMYQGILGDALRSILPVYTFATLNIMDEKGRPQSGFCTYFFDAEQRMSNMETQEKIRQSILGVGSSDGVRASLISTLRALHFMESERSIGKSNRMLPVLDPFGWVSPTTNREAGELEIMSRHKSGSVLLSFPAVLAHVTKILYKDRETTP